MKKKGTNAIRTVAAATTLLLLSRAWADDNVKIVDRHRGNDAEQLHGDRIKVSLKTATASTFKLCTYDSMMASWNVSFSLLREHCSGPLLDEPGVLQAQGPYLCVWMEQRNACVATRELCSPRVIEILSMEGSLEAPSEPEQVIWCAVDRNECTPPSATQAVATGQFGKLDDNSEETGLTITFDQSTNTPEVSSKEGVDRVLIFSEIIGSDYEGQWLDERTLRVIVKNSTGAAPRERLSMGNMRVQLRKVANFLSGEEKAARSSEIRIMAENAGVGSMQIRVSQEGTYSFQAIFPAIGRALAASEPAIDATHCGDVVVLTSEGERPLNMDGIEPTYSMNGVAALDGTIPAMILPTELLPFGGRGSFSMSMQIYLMEDANGKYRSLVFKGPIPSDGHRTPSVWLNPDSRRLSIRVSTSENMDQAFESTRELPLRKWTHLSLTFQNQSDSVLSASNYAMSLYMDGVRDISAKFRSKVLSNSAEMYVGKDPWSKGPVCLLANVKLYDRALTFAEIKHEVRRSASFKGEKQKSPNALRALGKVTGPAEVLRDDEANASPVESLGASVRFAGENEATSESKFLLEEATKMLSNCESTQTALKLLVTAGSMNNAEALALGASVLLHGAAAHAQEGSSCDELSMSALLSKKQWWVSKGAHAISKLASAKDDDAEERGTSATTAAHQLLVKAAHMGSGMLCGSWESCMHPA